MMLRFGIVGYGSFGSLLTRLIAEHAKVVIHSRRPIDSNKLPNNVSTGTLKDIAGCDVVILSTELSALEDYCKQLASLVSPDTIVMDVCSVKVLPAKILIKYLGEKCKVIATHPIFGPMSIGEGNAKGQKLVWHELSSGPFLQLEAFFKNTMGLEIVRMSPEEHDKQMSWVHCLTFFAGRGLLALNPPKSEVTSIYYQRLLQLVEIEKSHSYELFRTVQLGNLYAADIRKQYLDSLQKIDADLRKDTL